MSHFLLILWGLGVSKELTLIDFSSIKSGGGLQLSMNFISENSGSYTFVVSKSLYEYLVSLGIGGDYIVMPNNPFHRFIKEYTFLKREIKKRHFSKSYTFFGPGLPLDLKNIVSVAYPIVCYPDSKYWHYVPYKEKVIKSFFNWFRINRLKNASLIVCETEVMKKRLSSVLGKKQSYFIAPPVVTSFIKNISVEDYFDKAHDVKRLLVLGGLAYHKNNWRLYSVASELNKKGIDIVFYCSFSESDFISHVLKMSRTKIDSTILSKYFNFLGGVNPDKIGDLYYSASALINLSDLESFSNNYMESWKSALPILASDRDFSRHICGRSAIYFEPHDITSVADNIIHFLNLDRESLTKMLEEGKKRLALLPSIEEKRAIIDELLK